MALVQGERGKLAGVEVGNRWWDPGGRRGVGVKAASVGAWGMMGCVLQTLMRSCRGTVSGGVWHKVTRRGIESTSLAALSS